MSVSQSVSELHSYVDTFVIAGTKLFGICMSELRF